MGIGAVGLMGGYTTGGAAVIAVGGYYLECLGSARGNCMRKHCMRFVKASIEYVITWVPPPFTSPDHPFTIGRPDSESSFVSLGSPRRFVVLRPSLGMGGRRQCLNRVPCLTD